MQTNDAETAEQVVALGRVVSDLQELGNVLNAEQNRQTDALEKFAVDEHPKELAKISEEQRREFDALDFVGRLRLGSGRALWGWEEFHSGVLAWLLDPRGSHAMEDRFLTKFLRAVGVLSEAQTADWSRTSIVMEWTNQVDDEWGYLDILVLNEAGQALCAIENKVFSGEHSEQLTRYRKALERRYPDPGFSKRYVFLTPYGTLPYHPEEQRHWMPATYTTVLDVINQIIEENENPVKKDVCAFLRQYATTIRRNIVPETSVQQLARKIYLENREAMDLIIQFKPDFIAEAKEEFKKAIGRQQGWTVVYERNEWVNFRPDSWESLVTIPGEYSLLALNIDWRWDGGYPRLGLVVPPETDANREIRNQLHRAFLQHEDRFPGTESWRSSWLWLVYSDPILDESDYANWQDQVAVRAKIEAWVKNFAENVFPAMNDVIVNCLREYEPGQNSG